MDCLEDGQEIGVPKRQRRRQHQQPLFGQDDLSLQWLHFPRPPPTVWSATAVQKGPAVGSCLLQPRGDQQKHLPALGQMCSRFPVNQQPVRNTPPTRHMQGGMTACQPSHGNQAYVHTQTHTHTLSWPTKVAARALTSKPQLAAHCKVCKAPPRGKGAHTSASSLGSLGEWGLLQGGGRGRHGGGAETPTTSRKKRWWVSSCLFVPQPQGLCKRSSKIPGKISAYPCRIMETVGGEITANLTRCHPMVINTVRFFFNIRSLTKSSFS